MNMVYEKNKQQAVFNQLAWIFNYQPQIEHQHFYSTGSSAEVKTEKKMNNFEGYESPVNNETISDEHFAALFREEQGKFNMSGHVLEVKNDFEKWVAVLNYDNPSLEDLKDKRAKVLTDLFEKGAFYDEANEMSRTHYKNDEIDFSGMVDEDKYRRHYEVFKRLVSFEDGFIIYNKDVNVGKFFYYHRKDKNAEVIRTAFFTCKRFVELIQDEMRKFSEANQGMFDKLPESRQEIIRRVETYIDRGDWQEPATNSNIKAMMRQVLGVGDQKLTADEKALSKVLWDLLETGQGERVSVTFANLIGYFWFYRYLPTTMKAPKLCQKFFRNENVIYQNINKGIPGKKNMPPRFKTILPLLDTYRPKIATIAE